MPSLTIEMPSGVAGDMLLGAFLALGGDRATLIADLGRLGVGAIGVTATDVKVRGLAAVRVTVAGDGTGPWRYPAGGDHHHHGHRPYAMIRDLIAAAPYPDRVRRRAGQAFRLLAEAEAAVHGVPVDEVEFHEVGSLDAIVDVVGTALLLEQLDIGRVAAGPFRLGGGTVRCDHGTIPVPVPAVVEILARTRAPMRPGPDDAGELTTPTGCALVCAIADSWELPAGRVLKAGYGAGSREIPGMVNVLRAILVEERVDAGDTVAELRCEVDDATGQSLAVLLEDLIAAGALDAFITPVLMKKGRPGHLITVLVEPSQVDVISDLVFNGCSTIGLRWELVRRRILPRLTDEVEVEGLRVRVKTVELPGGGRRTRPESDDVRRLAARLGIGFEAAYLRILARLGF
jgi:hypothetical protein